MTGRVVSVDALRGFDMFWIIGGGALFKSFHKVADNGVTQTINRQLAHVAWEGFRFEDLIFPLFLFIVGLVLPFAITKRIERGARPKDIYLHILKRSAVLILLGLIFNGLLRFDIGQMRWLGVLQRIGLCYFFAAVIVLNTNWRMQVVITVVILLGYWAVTALVPVPGYGAGVYSAEGCLAGYIDRLIIPGRLCCYKYGDNEGLLSTIPAVGSVLVGALAGHWLRSENSGVHKSVVLMAAGGLCLIAGSGWGQVFPIVKNIWTSSYVLVAGGWSLLLLAVFYWLIDVRGYKRWAFFFVVIGANPITIYFAQRFVGFGDIANFFVHGAAVHTGAFEPVIVVCSVLLVKWLFLWFLYRHRIFFKV